eukprot:CAMPEP_0185727462 /NCGR_PEP_ID=MMETSP1171-20130828/3145_1 /TAXON_ID=374046 /ORGANISM="Helicotheca tamensis, Strain CCMP826" /LENGTH=94 /DNA_ID=CAMNT_0028396039 /DNA_START=141 /DNA_END=425 /DNA_ORIENTATION=-
MVLSKTNTDAMCCPTPPPTGEASKRSDWKHFADKCIYRYNLWTGLYMLEPHERLVFHALMALFVCCVCLYWGVFVRAFWVGWRDAGEEHDQTVG